MKAHILQHVPFEGPGVITQWLTDRGAEISFTKWFESSELPAPDKIDLLVVMGGPMSVNDEATFPWLAAEKQFIADTMACGKGVLGICLGAQLIASAHGARVFPNPMKEIGWFEITAVDVPAGSLHFPERATVLHWHGESFSLPTGANLLASSAACAHQAFQLGERTIGLQFHLEMTADTLRAIVHHCRDELVPARYVQDEATLCADATAHFESCHALMGQVLKYLTGE